MPRKLIKLAVALIGWSSFGSAAEAAFVRRDTLRPADTAPSVRAVVRDLSEGAVTLDGIEGIHHPRTIGTATSQANTAAIYARVSGELPSPIPGRPPLLLDRNIFAFFCDQLEDRRWLCSSPFLQSIVRSGSLITDFFFLEK